MFVKAARIAYKQPKAREEDPQYQHNLENIYLNQDNYDEAHRYFNKSLSLNPQYHMARNSIRLVPGMFSSSSCVHGSNAYIVTRYFLMVNVSSSERSTIQRKSPSSADWPGDRTLPMAGSGSLSQKQSR